MLFQGHYNSSPEKKETIRTVILSILLMVAIIILSCLLPDQGPNKIKQQLQERGYFVADTDFTLTKKFGDIYKSSRPITISEGISCEYWQLVSYGTFGIIQEVFPYPNGWPKPVNMSITFEPVEYQRLLRSAGNEPIESYIKEKSLLSEKSE